MLIDKINETIKACKIVGDSFAKGGLERPSQKIDKTVDMLTMLSIETEEEAKKRLNSKSCKDELDLLRSAVTDIKCLKDMCPSQLDYGSWRDQLSTLNKALNNLKQQ